MAKVVPILRKEVIKLCKKECCRLCVNFTSSPRCNVDLNICTKLITNDMSYGCDSCIIGCVNFNPDIVVFI